MPSRRLATVVTVVLVIAFAVVAVAPAFAAAPGAAPGVLPFHASLLGSTPKDGSTVDTAGEVVLEFNEDVDETFVEVTVEGPDGSEVQGEPEVDGRAVTQALSSDLPAGEHRVTYRVVSTDGHPVSGTLTFTSTVAPGQSAEPTALRHALAECHGIRRPDALHDADRRRRTRLRVRRHGPLGLDPRRRRPRRGARRARGARHPPAGRPGRRARGHRAPGHRRRRPAGRTRSRRARRPLRVTDFVPTEGG